MPSSITKPPARAHEKTGGPVARYESGVGVTADSIEAANWYLRAAERGHTSAQYNLGLMFYNGDGVAQDNVMAHVWTTLAAAHGHENAATARDAIAQQLTSTGIYESQ